MLIPSLTHIPTYSPCSAPSAIVHLIHHISTYQILTHSVSLTGLVCCVDSVNMVLVMCLAPQDVKYAHTTILYLFIIAPVVVVTLVLIVLIFICSTSWSPMVPSTTSFSILTYVVGIKMERYYPNCYNIACHSVTCSRDVLL